MSEEEVKALKAQVTNLKLEVRHMREQLDRLARFVIEDGLRASALQIPGSSLDYRMMMLEEDKALLLETLKIIQERHSQPQRRPGTERLLSETVTDDGSYRNAALEAIKRVDKDEIQP